MHSLADLGYDSEMPQQLLIDEAAHLIHLSVPTKFAVGQCDALVGETSARGIGLPGYSATYITMGNYGGQRRREAPSLNEISCAPFSQR